MKKAQPKDLKKHNAENSPFGFKPLSGARPSRLLELAKGDLGVGEDHASHMTFTLALSCFCAPLRVIEKLLYEKKLQSFSPKRPPIFVIGHWRSGTTHLHNLLAQDPNKSYLTAYRTWASEFSIISEPWLKPVIDALMPSQRPQDAMSLSADHPQEDEWALATIGGESFYNGFYFPKSLDSLSYTLAMDAYSDKRIIEPWCDQYRNIVTKLCYKFPQQQAVFKNPAHTGRIALLLKLFPNAKFVHIYRNPYKVFSSTVHLYESLFSTFGYHKPDGLDIKQMVVDNYRRSMTSFFARKHLIPQKNLFEIRYEEFAGNEIEVLAEAYQHLDIGDFSAAAPHMQEHLDSLVSYKRNYYPTLPEDEATVSREWDFSLRQLGYANRGRTLASAASITQARTNRAQHQRSSRNSRLIAA